MVGRELGRRIVLSDVFHERGQVRRDAVDPGRWFLVVDFADREPTWVEIPARGEVRLMIDPAGDE